MFSTRWVLPVALSAVVAGLVSFVFLIVAAPVAADSTVSIHGTLAGQSGAATASALPATSAASATAASPRPSNVDNPAMQPQPPQHLPAKPKVDLPPGVVARVYGQTITRAELTDHLQKFFSDQALITMVQQAAIRQAAKAEGVTATKEELDQAENKFYNDPHQYPLSVPLEERKENWSERLRTHGQTLESFRHELEVEVMLEKMVSSRVTVTDDDVHAAYDKYFGKGSPGEGTKFEIVRDGLRDRLVKERTPVVRKQLLNDIMKKADIQIGDPYPLEPQKQEGK